jgi:hypothetical protein
MEISWSPTLHFGVASILTDVLSGYIIVMRISTVGFPRILSPGGLSLFHDDVYILSLPADSSVLRDFSCRYFLFPEVWPDAEPHAFSLVQQITPSRIWIYHRREEGNF